MDYFYYVVAKGQPHISLVLASMFSKNATLRNK